MSNVTVGQPPRQVPPGARSHAELGAPAERPSLASTTRVSRPPSPPARNPEWLLGSLAPDRESCAGPGHRVIPAKQRRAFRSEERRVGKECTSRGTRQPEKKK